MKQRQTYNATTQLRTTLHTQGAIISVSREQVVKHGQKDTTNGAKRVRVEAYKDMALNSVVKLIESNEFKEKRRIERQQRREFFKARRMK